MERETLILRGLLGAVSVMCLLVLAAMLWLGVASHAPPPAQLVAGSQSPAACAVNAPRADCRTTRS